MTVVESTTCIGLPLKDFLATGEKGRSAACIDVSFNGGHNNQYLIIDHQQAALLIKSAAFDHIREGLISHVSCDQASCN